MGVGWLVDVPSENICLPCIDEISSNVEDQDDMAVSNTLQKADQIEIQSREEDYRNGVPLPSNKNSMKDICLSGIDEIPSNVGNQDVMADTNAFMKADQIDVQFSDEDEPIDVPFSSNKSSSNQTLQYVPPTAVEIVYE